MVQAADSTQHVDLDGRFVRLCPRHACEIKAQERRIPCGNQDGVREQFVCTSPKRAPHLVPMRAVFDRLRNRVWLYGTEDRIILIAGSPLDEALGIFAGEFRHAIHKVRQAVA